MLWKRPMGEPQLNITTDEQSLSWFSRRDEGELAVDVFENASAIFVKTAIAGIQPEDLQISLSHDMLTIRGTRPEGETAENRQYLTRECHWGAFSRSIILPANVRVDKAQATFQGGILLIKLPKTKSEGQIKVKMV